MRHLPRRGFEGVGQRSAFGQCPPDLSGATALQFPDGRQLEHRRRADETCRRKAHRRGHRQPGGLCSIAYAIKAPGPADSKQGCTFLFFWQDFRPSVSPSSQRRGWRDSLIEAGAPGAKREPDRAKPQLKVRPAKHLAELTTSSAPSLRSAHPPLLCEEGNVLRRRSFFRTIDRRETFSKDFYRE